ncbi:MAG TPA: ComEA family DNA-binding protein [Candidatus Cybelea sp.]|jgi:competence protein ComEA|nr:ComEA family DNA-binding protein [Candidatus Cybelea sp.]
MIVRIAVVLALCAVAAFAVWRPASHPALTAVASVSAPVAALPGGASDLPSPGPRRAGVASAGSAPAGSAAAGEVVVYVVGAVKRPGLYRLKEGDRYARAVELAGGLSAAADPRGVNLAQPAADGEEIDVPRAGAGAPSFERASRRASARTRDAPTRSRSHRRPPPPEGSVDVNLADAESLAAVPGIGRSLGARIVELREREGRFASLDELLDVAGMTQSKLERARPYLREP